jgi:hypothetical protein
MHTLWLLLGFPSGSVLTNLLASAIWATPTFLIAGWRARVHLRRLHARHDEHDARIAQLHAKVDGTRDGADG